MSVLTFLITLLSAYHFTFVEGEFLVTVNVKLLQYISIGNMAIEPRIAKL